MARVWWCMGLFRTGQSLSAVRGLHHQSWHTHSFASTYTHRAAHALVAVSSVANTSCAGLLPASYGYGDMVVKSCCADCLQGNVSVEHAAVIEQLMALQEQHKELQELDTATKVGPGACWHGSILPRHAILQLPRQQGLLAPSKCALVVYCR